ncbi:MAG: hypothetical protein H0V95_02550 [Actinobacteria bacterium]|nr:hypothetical protein [Actinomycetota bacterium]
MRETTTPEGKEQALAWIRRQLSWERTLADLRADRDERPEESRQAA